MKVSEFNRIGLTVALGLLVASCGARDEGSSTMTLDEALDLVTEDALIAHVSYLADDALEGRMTGQPGYDKAATYVAEQFAALGVEPAGNDGWYQQVPLVTYNLVPEASAVTLHINGEDVAVEYREQFAMGGDPLRESASVRAGLVFVGHGVHAPELGYSDYEGVNVEGKIVVMFNNAPGTFETTQRAYFASGETKLAEAVRRGAVGMIGLSTRESAEKYPWDKYKERIGVRPGMTWVTETGEASGYFPEIIARAGLNDEAAALLFARAPFDFEAARDAIEANRSVSVDLGIEATIAQSSTHDRLTSPNVVGLVRGTDPVLADEYVVFTAHLDHNGLETYRDGDKVLNGAYDNAIGVALMIETARVLAAAPPRRSVLFVALTAEERGLLGSEYFAEYPTVQKKVIVANINLDMPLFLFPVADLIAFGAEHSTLGAVAERAAIAEAFSFSPDPMPEENLFVRSDQYSFVKQGVPAVYLIPGFTSTDPDVDGDALVGDHLRNHYHEPSDDLARPFHWPSAARFARANARFGYEVAMDANRPRWHEGNFFGERFASP